MPERCHGPVRYGTGLLRIARVVPLLLLAGLPPGRTPSASAPEATPVAGDDLAAAAGAVLACAGAPRACVSAVRALGVDGLALVGLIGEEAAAFLPYAAELAAMRPVIPGMGARMYLVSQVPELGELLRRPETLARLPGALATTWPRVVLLGGELCLREIAAPPEEAADYLSWLEAAPRDVIERHCRRDGAWRGTAAALADGGGEAAVRELEDGIAVALLLRPPKAPTPRATVAWLERSCPLLTPDRAVCRLLRSPDGRQRGWPRDVRAAGEPSTGAVVGALGTLSREHRGELGRGACADRTPQACVENWLSRSLGIEEAIVAGGDPAVASLLLEWPDAALAFAAPAMEATNFAGTELDGAALPDRFAAVLSVVAAGLESVDAAQRDQVLAGCLHHPELALVAMGDGERWRRVLALARRYGDFRKVLLVSMISAGDPDAGLRTLEARGQVYLDQFRVTSDGTLAASRSDALLSAFLPAYDVVRLIADGKSPRFWDYAGATVQVAGSAAAFRLVAVGNRARRLVKLQARVRRVGGRLAGSSRLVEAVGDGLRVAARPRVRAALQRATPATLRAMRFAGCVVDTPVDGIRDQAVSAAGAAAGALGAAAVPGGSPVARWGTEGVLCARRALATKGPVLGWLRLFDDGLVAVAPSWLPGPVRRGVDGLAKLVKRPGAALTGPAVRIIPVLPESARRRLVAWSGIDRSVARSLDGFARDRIAGWIVTATTGGVRP